MDQTTIRTGTRNGGLQPMMLHRRTSPGRRLALIVLLAASWGLGLAGLDGGRLSSVQVIAAGLIVLIVSRLVAVHRRRTELTRARAAKRPVVQPRTCVVLRKFGEEGDRTTGSRN